MNLHHILTRIGYGLLLAALLAACGSAPESAPTPGLMLPTPLVTPAETAVPLPNRQRPPAHGRSAHAHQRAHRRAHDAPTSAPSPTAFAHRAADARLHPHQHA
jgi:hypothetical protein